MKHLPMLFLILFSVVLCSNSAQAQTISNVCQAQLFFADINAQGKLITSGNAVVFIDDQSRSGLFSQQPAGPSEALLIDRSNISSVNPQPSTLSIYTNRMVNYRSRQEKSLTFRFNSGNCPAIVVWLKKGSSSSPPSKPRKQPPLILRANHKRNMRPDISGNLIISETMITFGNRRGSTYQWDLRDIKDIKDIRRYGNHMLEIIPFAGGKFTFDLLGRGISPQDFSALRDRIMRQ